MILSHGTAWNAVKVGEVDETPIQSDVWLREQNNPSLTRRLTFMRFYGLAYNYIVLKQTELKIARMLVNELSADWNPEQYTDDADYCRERTEEVLTYFPRLRERWDQKAGTLSGGEQQMLAIGRAMMSRPKLLMLDEPSMGLSPLMMKTVMSTVTTLQEQGTTILLVEQNAAQALRRAANPERPAPFSR